MPIFMRFEHNAHVETTTLQKKPEEDNWLKAPSDFEWGKAYCLIDGKILEQTAEALEHDTLTAAKVQALQTVRVMIDAKRKEYVGYSPEKSKAYDVKADVAEKIIQQEECDTYVPLIESLAKLRGITVIDMAKLIQGKAHNAAKILLQCEFLEDQAKQSIHDIVSVADLEIFISTFNNTLGALK